MLQGLVGLQPLNVADNPSTFGGARWQEAKESLPNLKVVLSLRSLNIFQEYIDRGVP